MIKAFNNFESVLELLEQWVQENNGVHVRMNANFKSEFELNSTGSIMDMFTPWTKLKNDDVEFANFKLSSKTSAFLCMYAHGYWNVIINYDE